MAGEPPKESEELSHEDTETASAGGGATGATPPEQENDATAEQEAPVSSLEADEGRPTDDVSAIMEAAIAAETADATETEFPQPAPQSAPANSVALELPDFRGGEAVKGRQSIGILNDVALNVKIELGRSSMYIEEVLCLAEGSVVELDKLAGDPVDILVNERLVARGEVLVLNDNFCVRISEILTPAAEELAASQEN